MTALSSVLDSNPDLPSESFKSEGANQLIFIFASSLDTYFTTVVSKIFTIFLSKQWNVSQHIEEI